jgi:hypothetical protein
MVVFKVVGEDYSILYRGKVSEFDPGKIIMSKVLTQEGGKLEMELLRYFSEESSLVECEFREPDYSLQVLLTGALLLLVLSCTRGKHSLTFPPQ